ncbi:hypothetical protein [Winogradskyella sp.]|uniref:hypothetical protein n=1 Tax=Winogradskyella sp. TaxID=1883156 RepID=UPI003F6C9B02
MKKSIIIFVVGITTVSLLSFGCKNQNNSELKSSINKSLVAENQEKIEGPNFNFIPDLYYGIDARFAPVTKADVHNATTIYDFLNEGEKAQIEHIYSVDVILVKNNQLSEIRASGTTDLLTDQQLKIIKSTDYFTHFTIRTEFKGKNLETGKIEDKFFGPHITVVPKRQASYIDGKDALLNYLKQNSAESMNAIKDNKLGAIKLSFIVSKEGIVKDVKHDAMTTGYPSIDERLRKLLENIPGKWIPAENARGAKIDQELVFTFGPRDGC